MTREECINTLRGSMHLILFNPSTGEVKNPDELNDMDRMTYDAMQYAADFLETHPERGRKRYFYTFGTDPQFPYGIEEFVEVHADTANQANPKFKIAFPCRPGSTLLNCAFVYNEDEWKQIWEQDYNGKKPIIIID